MTKNTQYGGLAYSAPSDWTDSTVASWVIPDSSGRRNQLSITLVQHSNSEEDFDPEQFLYAQLNDRSQFWTTSPVIKPDAITIHDLELEVSTIESTFASPAGEVWQLQAAFQCASHDYVFTATGLSDGDTEYWRHKFQTLVSSVRVPR